MEQVRREMTETYIYQTNKQTGFKKITSITSCIILVGIIAGLGSVAFQYLCQIGVHFFLDYLAGYRPPSAAGETDFFSPTSTTFNRWLLLFLPAIGGLISGWIAYTFAPEAGGMAQTLQSRHTITKKVLSGAGYQLSNQLHLQ
jgi:H+/Cl- antiporter ClcA